MLNVNPNHVDIDLSLFSLEAEPRPGMQDVSCRRWYLHSHSVVEGGGTYTLIL